jgi:hypothetical protein
MARKTAASAPARAAARARRDDSQADDSHAEFLVLALMSAIVPIIEARCGALNKRDVNTLKRHVEKAVRQFIQGAQKRR